MSLEDFTEAFRALARKENIPASLTSDQWLTVPAEVRERSFFMSQVADASLLEDFRKEVDAVANGESSVNDAEKRLDFLLKERNYVPPIGKEGGLEDLSSLRRINLVLQTNQRFAREYARYSNQQRLIKIWPAAELVRDRVREEPRDWPSIWREAVARISLPGAHPTQMIALINHPVWTAISDFGQPYPIFKWGSGMGTRMVGRDEAEGLGIYPSDPNDPMIQERSMSLNEGLESGIANISEGLKERLAKRLGRFGDVEGDKAVFTDPDGTKKYSDEKLAEIWKRPAPEGYDRLTQKDQLDKFLDGNDIDSEGRVTLARLFNRLERVDLGEGKDIFAITNLVDDLINAVESGISSISIPSVVPAIVFNDSIPEKIGKNLLLKIVGRKRPVKIDALSKKKGKYIYSAGEEFRIISREELNGVTIITLEQL